MFRITDRAIPAARTGGSEVVDERIGSKELSTVDTEGDEAAVMADRRIIEDPCVEIIVMTNDPAVLGDGEDLIATVLATFRSGTDDRGIQLITQGTPFRLEGWTETRGTEFVAVVEVEEATSSADTVTHGTATAS